MRSRTHRSPFRDSIACGLMLGPALWSEDELLIVTFGCVRPFELPRSQSDTGQCVLLLRVCAQGQVQGLDKGRASFPCGPIGQQGEVPVDRRKHHQPTEGWCSGHGHVVDPHAECRGCVVSQPDSRGEGAGRKDRH
eukprot:5537413-Lingulodinium_polyedra.AAC.1